MISVLSSVVLAVMALLLSGWVIFCAIQFFRFSRNMVASGDFKAHVQCEKCGTKISVSEVKPGDLIFYGSGRSINHVAMYIGNGQVVHASNSRTGIIISNMYYRSPVSAARIIND